jgi:poly(3-hydroxyalkanoate) synthetase
VPVLLTYGFVLKPYVFDLAPGNSVVENLVKAGFDVYMLDFGVPGPHKPRPRPRSPAVQIKNPLRLTRDT